MRFTKLISIFLIILNLSCSTKTKKSGNDFDLTNSHKLEFLNKNIYLPKNYKATTVEELIIARKVDGKFESFQTIQNEKLYEQKRSGEKFEIFCDKNNLKNSIIFSPGEYMPLNKNLISPYVIRLEKDVKPELSKHNIGLERLESKFITSENTKSIKIKHRLIFDDKNIYLTQYIVTYKFNTFSIVVSNEKNIDYKFILKNFSTY